MSAMYAAREIGAPADVPEWKRLLIMRKRAGPAPDEPPHGGPLPNGAAHGPHSEATPPRTVTRTIGPLHVALRSVSGDGPDFSFGADGSSPRAGHSFGEPEGEADLPYGPGIVDRLRARFLSLGAGRGARKPVVRRFSSLESLPGSRASGPLRPRGIRQNGKLFGGQAHVKKAQSMETLPSGAHEPNVPLHRAGHVRGRLASGWNGSRIADEHDAPNGEISPNPEGPRRSWEYGRSIREDELPRPDTVKQVKKMFESPDAADGSGRFRPVKACNGVSPDPVGRPCNGTGEPPLRHGQPAKVEANGLEEVSEEDSETARLTSAKEGEDSDAASDGTEYDPPADEDEPDRSEGADAASPANGAPRTLVPDDKARLKREESEESFVVCEAAKVTPERSPPFAETPWQEEEEAQVELAPEAEEQPTLVADLSPDDGEPAMVVAAAAFQKPWAAKQPPQPAASVVFDFRGKDVKPNVSLNPTPFGCRAARVSRRAGSPPEGPDGDAEDDDWDEADVGADLPAVCGIAFHGENVRVGRGALLETRNKKLTIQFDDGATSTFEYPSELDSPSDENGLTSPPAITMDSPANARLGLSNYTPHVLSIDDDFQLGMSRPSQRPMKPLPKVPTEEEVTTPDDIVPAEEAAVWSSAETTDILF